MLQTSDGDWKCSLGIFRVQLPDKAIENPNTLPIRLVSVGGFHCATLQNFGTNFDSVNKRNQLFTIQCGHIRIAPDMLRELIVLTLDIRCDFHRV